MTGGSRQYCTAPGRAVCLGSGAETLKRGNNRPHRTAPGRAWRSPGSGAPARRRWWPGPPPRCTAAPCGTAAAATSGSAPRSRCSAAFQRTAGSAGPPGGSKEWGASTHLHIDSAKMRSNTDLVQGRLQNVQLVCGSTVVGSLQVGGVDRELCSTRISVVSSRHSSRQAGRRRMQRCGMSYLVAAWTPAATARWGRPGCRGPPGAAPWQPQTCRPARCCISTTTM
jgi:hypothetical protein